MRFEKDLELVRWLENSNFSKANFQWDKGNSLKNLKHGVSKEEIESLFISPFVLAGKIIEPYHAENRWLLFGKTVGQRRLTLIFTVRDGKKCARFRAEP